MSARKAPEVVGGTRSPLDAAQREEGATSGSGNDLMALLGASIHTTPPVHVDGRVFTFGSKFRRHRLSVKKLLEKAVLNEETGRFSTFEIKDIQFEDNCYRTSDPAEAALIRACKRFGLEVWDQDEKDRAQAQLMAEQLIERVDDLPADLKDRLRRKLGPSAEAHDFALPFVREAAPPAPPDAE
jgi:hypothetical protein